MEIWIKTPLRRHLTPLPSRNVTTNITEDVEKEELIADGIQNNAAIMEVWRFLKN